MVSLLQNFRLQFCKNLSSFQCFSHLNLLNLITIVIVSQRYIDLNSRYWVHHGYVFANPLCCTPKWRMRIEPRPTLESGKEYTTAVCVFRFYRMPSQLWAVPLSQLPRLTKSPSPAERRGIICFIINHHCINCSKLTGV